jgi:hypothetical protein
MPNELQRDSPTSVHRSECDFDRNENLQASSYSISVQIDGCLLVITSEIETQLLRNQNV